MRCRLRARCRPRLGATAICCRIAGVSPPKSRCIRRPCPRACPALSGRSTRSEREFRAHAGNGLWAAPQAPPGRWSGSRRHSCGPRTIRGAPTSSRSKTSRTGSPRRLGVSPRRGLCAIAASAPGSQWGLRAVTARTEPESSSARRRNVFGGHDRLPATARRTESDGSRAAASRIDIGQAGIFRGVGAGVGFASRTHRLTAGAEETSRRLDCEACPCPSARAGC